MIIKEFRVVVPMSVEEYQIGQLYTIQKKSRLETTGAGSGVEIIENRPYESKTEKGQYTLKVYHVDERLPAGLKTLSKLLFPKSALLFEEESWNCYPYTRTKYSHKFFKSFYVDIQSRYLPDLGQSDNVFNLSSSELAQRSVDYIDIVNDPISPNEYKTETDPQLFVSAKTNRGPMHPQWLEEMRGSASSAPDPSQLITSKKTRALLNGHPVEFMCCYKLCRIECAFWGCQSRVEKLVSESVIRHMVFLSHREAWCWQDEYYGLTMQDVRELENETQRYLNAKMRNNSLMEEDLASLPNQSKKNSTDTATASSSNQPSVSAAAAAGKTIATSPTPSTSTIVAETSSSASNSIDIKKPGGDNKSSSSPEKQQQTLRDTTNLYGKKTSIVSVAKSIETDSGDDFEDFPSSITNAGSPGFEKMKERNEKEQNNRYFKNHGNDEEEEYSEQNYSGEEEENEQEVPFGHSSEDERASQHSDEFFDAISQISFNFSTNTTELDTKSTHTVNFPPSSSGGTNKLKMKPKKLFIVGSKKKQENNTTSPTKQQQKLNEQENKSQSNNNSTFMATKMTTPPPTTTTTTQTTTTTKNIELSRSIFNNSTTSSSSSNSSSSASTTTNPNAVNRQQQQPLAAINSSKSSSSSSTVTASTTSTMKASNTSQPNKFGGFNPAANRSQIDILIMVVHGGNVTCTDTSKQSDFANFKSTMDSVIKANYAHLQGRIAYRLVPCDSICKDVLVKLAALSPIVNQQTCSLNNVLNDSDDFAETSAAVFSVHESLPFNTLPLLATANSLQYRNHLSVFIRQCNKVYQEFVQSIGGLNAIDGASAFNGQVVLVADSLGSLLAYDALTQINLAASTRASDEHLSSSTSSITHPTTTTTKTNQMSSTTPTTPTMSLPTPLSMSSGDDQNRSTSPRRKESSSSSSTGGGGGGGGSGGVNTNPIISINDEERRLSQQQDTISLEAAQRSHHHHHHHHHHSHHNKHNQHHHSPNKPISRNLSDSEFVTPAASTSSFLTPNSNSQLLTAGDLSRSSSMTCVDERLEFQVAHFFIFGSPLGLVLAYRKIGNNQLEPPIGSQIYNLFHLTDPIAVRIEPLLCKQFKYIDPCMVPRYSKFPLGDGLNLTLDHYIVKHGNLFDTKNLIGDKGAGNSSNDSPTIAMNSSDIYFANSWLASNLDHLKSLQKILYTKKNWWGDNRIDYVLYAPEKITNLPRISLPYIFHSCYWESTDVVAFVLRMIFRHEFDASQTGQASINDMYKAVNASPLSAMAVGGRGGGGSAHGNAVGQPGSKEPVEKFQKRLNRVKLRNLSANHRANDVIVLEDKEQILTAKFSYGPLDFALSGEKVDIFITSSNNSSSASVSSSAAGIKGGSSTSVVSTTVSGGEWRLLASAVTDSHGRLKYELPKDRRLPLGMYHIKCVVKCDHTFVDFQMAVLPAQTEAVVFSIDGSFAANISFSGTDPKVRAGAVDVVRYWQDLGYLIIYITARPDIQHYKVTNWLAQHNFPLGMVFFSEGICRDPLRQKTENLRSIVIGNQLKLQAGYGSPKDIPMYASLGVAANRIFIIGKVKNKYLNHAVFLQDGYASHLTYLQNPNTGCRQATGNARLIIKKATFTVKHNTMFSNPSSLTSASSESTAATTKPSSLILDTSQNAKTKSKLQTPPPGTIIPPILPSQTNTASSKSSLHDSMRSTQSESSARSSAHANSLRQTPSSAPIPNISSSTITSSAPTSSSSSSSSNNNNNNNTHHLAFPFHA